MKKILSFSLIMVLFTVAASAQQTDRFRKQRSTQGFSNGQITRPERFELRKDVARQNFVKRNIHRDGRVTPMERKRLHKAKCETRRDAFRFKHNGRRR